MSKDNNVSFRGQREDENLLLLIHRHPWGLAKQGLIVVVGLVIISLAFYYFKASGLAVWTFFIVGLAVFLYGLYSWFVWWNNLYLLTNERIIVIVQRGLWSRRIEDYALEKIQSVASDTGGPAGTLLNFGTVSIAIMGIKNPVGLPFIEDPYAVQEKILSAIKSSQSGGRLKQPEQPAKRRRLQH